MPGMDGFETANCITRTYPELASRIIMLRSAGAPGTSASRAAAGIAATLSKPIRRDELLTAICAVVEAAPLTLAKAAASIAVVERQALDILLVEDNPVSQLVTVRLLEKSGHRVQAAGNGREAVAAWEAAQGFDVILMDVEMPEMDGFAATAAIRASETATGRRQPIIAMTARAMSGDAEECLAAGMDGYVSKPIDRDRVLAEIHKLLPGRAGEAAFAGQAGNLNATS
jgi:two-component system sensor histidine kinase/response regulator